MHCSMMKYKWEIVFAAMIYIYMLLIKILIYLCFDSKAFF